MEYISYKAVSDNGTGINTASYINSTEYSLLYDSINYNIWFGSSPKDQIEISVFNRNKELVSWTPIEQSQSFVKDSIVVAGEFQTLTSSYTNGLQQFSTYSYNKFVSNYILYKNQHLLRDVAQDLSQSFGLVSGSFEVGYNFIRNVAGDIKSPLIIKEISTSRRELKLIPSITSSIDYISFCQKKIVVLDISAIYIEFLKNFSADTIYSETKTSNSSEIESLKHIFSLSNDGEVSNFINNLYEDDIKYFSSIEHPYAANVSEISRRIGIRNRFQNYLLTNLNSITTFESLDLIYSGIVKEIINSKFSAVESPGDSQNLKVKEYLYSIFTNKFYSIYSDFYRKEYNEKYY